MMMRVSKALALVWVVLVVLVSSGCIKTYQLVPSETGQPQDHKDQREIVKNNVQSVRVYNQWETVAGFDVLWMSDEVREAYVNTFCARRGKDEASRDTMLQRQLEENQQNIAFYVLADVRDKTHPSLSDAHATWTMYLDLGQNEKLAPISVTEVDLDPEIQGFFGFRFPRAQFKTAFLVKFSAKTLAGIPCIPQKQPFKMIFSSVARQVEVGWNGAVKPSVTAVTRDETKTGKLIKDEDFYWL